MIQRIIKQYYTQKLIRLWEISRIDNSRFETNLTGFNHGDGKQYKGSIGNIANIIVQNSFLDVLKNPEVKEISSLSTICTSDVNHELKNTEGEFNLKLKQKTQRYERVKQAQNSKQKGKKGRNKEDQNKDSDIDENSNSSDDE